VKSNLIRWYVIAYVLGIGAVWTSISYIIYHFLMKVW
jgi:hypothetical protein